MLTIINIRKTYRSHSKM